MHGPLEQEGGMLPRVVPSFTFSLFPEEFDLEGFDCASLDLPGRTCQLD